MLIVCVYFIVRNFDLEKLNLLNWQMVVIGLIIFIASLLLRTVDSKIILDYYLRQVKFLDILMVNLLTHLANMSVSSKVAIPMRLYLYKSMIGVDYPVATVALTLKIFLDLVVTALIALALMIYLPAEKIYISPLWPILIIILLITSYLIIIKIKLNIPKIFRHPRLKKIVYYLANTKNAIRYLPRSVIMWVALIEAANVIVVSLFTFILIRQFGYQTGPETVLFSYSVATLVGVLSMVPLGLGTTEASFTLLMKNFGCPVDVAVTTIIVQRIFWLFLPLIFGMPIYIGKGMSLWKAYKKDHG